METRPGETRPRATEPPQIGGQTSGRGDFASGVNVGDGERVVSSIAGAALLLLGLARSGIGRFALTGLGAALAYRGIMGHSFLYRFLGINRASREPGRVQGNLGIKVEQAVHVNAPPEQVYAAWRNLSNLPRFMSHLERVEELDRTRSRWTVRAPAGMKISWEAEIINEIPNRVIAWRTIGNEVVAHAGSVQFERAAEGRATIVRVSMQYDPLAGALGQALAAALGADPQKQIEQDLTAFKRAMEQGELAA
jgi:uncharacterized membrane protein